MKKTTLASIIVLIFTLFAFPQDDNKNGVNSKSSEDKQFSESIVFKVGKPVPPESQKKKSGKKKKKPNPKKEAKRKARAEKKRLEAERKWAKEQAKIDAEFARITEKWLKADNAIARNPKRVTIPITVYHKDGERVTDLKADEIEVFEDGVKQKLLNYGIFREPMTTVILFDLSPSTSHRYSEIRKFLKKLSKKASPANRIIIAGFDSKFKIISETLTSEKGFDKIIKKFRRIGSGTSIYDAVTKFCKVFSPKIQGRKALIIFSDGVDTTSRRSTYESSIRYVQKSNLTVSSIYYNSRSDFASRPAVRNRTISGNPQLRNILADILRRLPPSQGTGTSKFEYLTGRRYMEDLILASGGRLFNTGNSKSQFEAAFDEAFRAARTQTYVEYDSDRKPDSGKDVITKIRVKRPNLRVHTRDRSFLTN